MGRNRIIQLGICAYIPWLQAIHEHAHGDADYSAHFFRRAYGLLGGAGTVGLIATNTIAQGRTRETGLSYLVERGANIYSADCHRQWPGEAGVTVSVVHLVKSGDRSRTGQYCLDGVPVPAISSWLQQGTEWRPAVSLRANQLQSFAGSKLCGSGFVLTPQAREELIDANPEVNALIPPYIGGEQMNTSPTQTFKRYVIDFGDMTLAQAEHWPQLLKIVREKVKPERDKNNRTGVRPQWWQFERRRPELYQAINQMQRCLAASTVTKHLCFSFQPTERIYSNTLSVFALDTNECFAVLQSRLHECWARQLCSTMETRLRYAPTDCFRNFPFPHTDPGARDPALDAAGHAYYTARADYMRKTWQGLTKTYNAMTDPSCHEPEIVHLRHLHEQIDQAVLTAYGWSDIVVPPYCPTTPEDRAALDSFRQEVFQRLLQLNAVRAAEERQGS